MPETAEPARSAAEALRRYRRYMQLPLSCIHRTAQWYSAPSGGREELALLTLPNTIPLNHDRERLYLVASQLFVYVEDAPEPGQWKVGTREYIYTLAPDENLKDKIIEWHWHPYSRPDPHIHVRADHGLRGPLGKFHVPSSRVSFEAIIRFLIKDLGVPPARKNYRAVLAETERRFLTYRSWHHSYDPEQGTE